MMEVIWSTSLFLITSFLPKKPHYHTLTPLPDLLHSYYPPFQPDWLSDVLVVLFVLFAVVFFFLRRDTTRLLRALILCLFMYSLKKIFSYLTILPDPSGRCHKKPWRWLLGDCHDLLFSGHAGIMFLFSFLLWDQLPSRSWKYTLLAYNIVVCFLIILSRNHYTIDVVVSFFVVYFIYHQYRVLVP